MIIGKSKRDLWDKYKDDFLKYYSDESRKPLTHSNLVKRFVDSNGKQLYGFHKDMALPLERFAKLKEFMQYLAKGLTAEEDALMDDAIEKILMDGLGKNKGAAGIGAIIEERRRRRNSSIHSELFYNYLAVQLVYEDENPETYDNDFQKKKVIQFKTEVQKQGAYFFFQQPELKKLNDLLRLPEKEWMQSWEESLIQQQLLPEKLKAYTFQTT